MPYVGGGYGGKLYVKAEPISAALTWMTRRPVKLQLSVNESFKTVTRHPARVTVKTGVTKDGKLIARECQVYMDTGAYADAGPRVTQKAAYRSLGPLQDSLRQSRSLRRLHATRFRPARFAALARCK